MVACDNSVLIQHAETRHTTTTSGNMFSCSLVSAFFIKRREGVDWPMF